MRCRPGEANESEGDPQRLAVAKVCGLIQKERKDGEKWSVKSLAKEAGLTESHFCRIFKKIMGLTVGEYRASIVGKEEVVVRKVGVPNKSAPVFMENGAAVASLEFPYIPGTVEAQDSVTDFDSELARNWCDFSGVTDLPGTLEMYPGIHGSDNFNFSPEMISDASTPATVDDGFQFLDFDAVS